MIPSEGETDQTKMSCRQRGSFVANRTSKSILEVIPSLAPLELCSAKTTLVGRQLPTLTTVRKRLGSSVVSPSVVHPSPHLFSPHLTSYIYCNAIRYRYNDLRSLRCSSYLSKCRPESVQHVRLRSRRRRPLATMIRWRNPVTTIVSS